MALGKNEDQRIKAMVKSRRPNLAALTQDSLPQTPEPPAGDDVVSAVPTGSDLPPTMPATGTGRSKVQHTSLYLDPDVHMTIKRIALDYRKKPHDLVLEGIEMMLIKYVGKTMKDISAS